MASSQEEQNPVSFFERLLTSENPEISPFLLPFLIGGTRPNSDGSTRDRFVFINPVNQSMLILDSAFRVGSDKTGQPPAAKSAVENLPRVEITEEEEEDRGECVICLEEYKVGTTVKKMPCQHGFHEGCIEKWLGLHGSCPVCRYVLPVDDGDDVANKADDVESEEGGNGGRVSVGFGVRVRVELGVVRQTGGGGGGGGDGDDDPMEE